MPDDSSAAASPEDPDRSGELGVFVVSRSAKAKLIQGMTVRMAFLDYGTKLALIRRPTENVGSVTVALIPVQSVRAEIGPMGLDIGDGPDFYATLTAAEGTHERALRAVRTRLVKQRRNYRSLAKERRRMKAANWVERERREVERLSLEWMRELALDGDSGRWNYWGGDPVALQRGDKERLVGATESEFICNSCGRLTDARTTYETLSRIVPDNLRPLWRELHVSVFRPVRAGDLQKAQRLSYEGAADLLAGGERLGLLVRVGKGYRPAEARCSECVQSAAQPRAESEAATGVRDLVPPQLRFRVLHRDAFRCQYCGRSPREGAILHLDHVVPFSRGGETTEDNLITACDQCNLGKAAENIV